MGNWKVEATEENITSQNRTFWGSPVIGKREMQKSLKGPMGLRVRFSSLF